MKILILSADRFEDSELLVPREQLQAAGVTVEVASFAAGPIHGKHGATVQAVRAVHNIDAKDYAALLLPGGKAPAALRRDQHVLALVREFFAAGKPVAAICHGPQILVDAGVLRGRAATAHFAVAEELRTAGARYRDAETVVDGNLVTARMPADLPAFVRELFRLLGISGHSAVPPAA